MAQTHLAQSGETSKIGVKDMFLPSLVQLTQTDNCVGYSVVHMLAVYQVHKQLRCAILYDIPHLCLQVNVHRSIAASHQRDETISLHTLKFKIITIIFRGVVFSLSLSLAHFSSLFGIFSMCVWLLFIAWFMITLYTHHFAVGKHIWLTLWLLLF